jgi:cell division protein FtsZ
MVEYERTASSDGTSSLRICVAGVGGAGSNVIDRVTMDRTLNATLVSLQTDVRVLNQSMAPKKVQLGAELMRGVGTGGDPDLGREAALYSKDRIREALDGHDMVFLSVGLGGGTGSGAAPVVAEIAKSLGAVVVVFAAVPFSFEGRRRIQQAQDALDRLQKSADALILFDNNRMGELVLGKEGIQKTFAQADGLIGQSVRAVSGMVGQPGLVKLGLADLVSALRVSDGRCLFGFGEAKGASRGTEAMKKALKSPLINNGQLLNNARNLLVHIVGGETLTLAEVEGIMKQLGRHVPDETQLLFGVSIDPKLGDSISVTLISALSAEQLASAAIQPLADTGRVQLKPAPEPVVASSMELAPSPVAPAPADLFGEPIQRASARGTRTPPPVLAPEPTPEPEEVVDEVEEEIEEEEEPVAEVAPPPVAAPAPIPAPVYREEPAKAPAAPPPLPKSSGFSLASVISGSDGGSTRSATAKPVVRDENARYAPQAKSTVNVTVAVEPPLAETAPVQLPGRTANVVSRQAPTADVAVLDEPPPVIDEVSDEFQLDPDPVTSVAVAEAPVETKAPVAITNTVPSSKATPDQQANLKLGGEDRGRFNGTDSSVVEGEDLDTPTWMRMRRARGR